MAIAIPPGPADELERWRERFGDPAAHLIPAHITLLPPTTVQDMDAVIAHLEAVAARHSAFEVHLQGTGTFRPVSPVVYVRISKGVRDIETLEADVRSGPLGRRLRFEYHPHVTVAHDLPDDVLSDAQRVLADYDASFQADAITVFERDPAGVWNALHHCQLQP